jgi:hypothetical protein
LPYILFTREWQSGMIRSNAMAELYDWWLAIFMFFRRKFAKKMEDQK